MHRRGGEPARPDDAAEVALEERHAGALDGDVRPGAHGDADVGGGERRGVVDAVAGHGDDAAVVAEALHHLALAIWQHFGLDLVDAELARHGLGGGAVVAGEHDDADALGMKVGDRLRRRLLDRIGDGDDAGRLAIDRRPARRWRRPRASRPRSASGVDGDALAGEEAGIADDAGDAVDAALGALAGRAVEIGRLGEVQTAFARLPRRWPRRADARSRARGWRRGAAARSRRTRAAARLRSPRLALGQRAGLVDDERIDALHALQRRGILDQDAELGAAADADHDRHRRREAERAGAGDDENADRGDQREGEARLRSPDRPGGEGEQRHTG